MEKAIIFIGADHNGFDLKEEIVKYLKSIEFKVEDIGTNNSKTFLDFPDYALAVCKKVLSIKNSLGILICETGIGMSICANKIKGIRCELGYDHYTSRMGKEHNNSNVLALEGKTTGILIAKNAVDMFINSEFLSDPIKYNHYNRVVKIGQLEERIFCNIKK